MFVFATEQSDDVELGRIILSNLVDMYTVYGVDFIYSHLIDYIQDRTKSGNCGYNKSKNFSESRFILSQDMEKF